RESGDGESTDHRPAYPGPPHCTLLVCLGRSHPTECRNPAPTPFLPTMTGVSRVPLAAVSLLTVLALGGCGADGGTPERAAAPDPTAHPTHRTNTASPTVE